MTTGQGREVNCTSTCHKAQGAGGSVRANEEANVTRPKYLLARYWMVFGVMFCCLREFKGTLGSLLGNLWLHVLSLGVHGPSWVVFGIHNLLSMGFLGTRGSLLASLWVMFCCPGCSWGLLPRSWVIFICNVLLSEEFVVAVGRWRATVGGDVARERGCRAGTWARAGVAHMRTLEIEVRAWRWHTGARAEVARA